MAVISVIAGNDPFVAVFLAVVAVLIGYEWYASVRYPATLPRIREKPGSRGFSWKTRLAYYRDGRNLLFEAQEKFSSLGKTVAFPGIGVRTEIILPISATKWITSQPERVLSVRQMSVAIDQIRWIFGTNLPATDPWQGTLIKTHLNSVLEDLMTGVNIEFGLIFDELVGNDTENWKEFNVLDLVSYMIGRVSSRFTVGLPLCRNNQYLADARSIVDAIFFNAGTGFGTPYVLRPLLAIPFTLYTRYKLGKLEKLLRPLHQERLAFIKDNPIEGAGPDEEPCDHFQIMLRYAQRERPHELHDLGLLTRRLVFTNFGSMHQTTLAAANLVLNAVGSNAEHGTVGKLREEVERVLGTDFCPGGGGVFAEGAFTKARVAAMVRADSLARETFRLHPFGSRALPRVVAADGVRTEDGVDLPRGAMISVLSSPAAASVTATGEPDEADPAVFDPFRFSRRTEGGSGGAAGPAAGEGRDENKTTSSPKPLSLVTTGPLFLPFGHGRSACPGRFLLDFELKMLLAYLVTRYDVKFPEEYGGGRPATRWLAEAQLPPPDAKILLKRRT